MQIDLKTLNPKKIYGLMTQTIVPRPIAWVLSDNGDGSHNLAPFSYFNAVCSNPPLIVMSIGWKNEQTPKDTARNIGERNEFVIHIAHKELLDKLNASSATLDHGTSEVNELGLETTPLDGFRLPRLKAARIAFACRKYDIQYLGPAKQHLVIAQIEQVYVADEFVEVVDGRLTVDPVKLDPLTRLGPGLYSSLAEIISLQKPD